MRKQGRRRPQVEASAGGFDDAAEAVAADQEGAVARDAAEITGDAVEAGVNVRGVLPQGCPQADVVQFGVPVRLSRRAGTAHLAHQARRPSTNVIAAGVASYPGSREKMAGAANTST